MISDREACETVHTQRKNSAAGSSYRQSSLSVVNAGHLQQPLNIQGALKISIAGGYVGWHGVAEAKGAWPKKPGEFFARRH
jgi:hypothetical protein